MPPQVMDVNISDSTTTNNNNTNTNMNGNMNGSGVKPLNNDDDKRTNNTSSSRLTNNNSTNNNNTMPSEHVTLSTATTESQVNTILSTLSTINEPQSKSSNLTSLQSLGGIPGLLSLLNTTKTGINTGGSGGATIGRRGSLHLMSAAAGGGGAGRSRRGSIYGNLKEEILHRRSKFGSNSLPSSPRKSWIELFIDTFDDDTLQILIVAAVVSLAVGIYEDPSSGYIEGCAILAAVLIVSVVTACNDYQKESQFRSLSNATEEVDTIVVLRNGTSVQIPIQEIVLGDVVCIEAGDSIPCDGVLLHSNGLSVDESALTGEPIDIFKDIQNDPFVLSGCIATAGSASFVSIGVGANSQWGTIKSKLEKEQDDTPLQEKLDTMANQIGNVGIAAAIATGIAMIIIHQVVKPPHLEGVSIWTHALDAFIIGVTIVVVAVPEGLPLAVTISLAYSTKQMLTDRNLIRHLDACETMGNATNICSDKTGTLTENRMTVVKGWFADMKYDNVHLQSKEISVADPAKEHILNCIGTCSTAQILQRQEPTDESNNISTSTSSLNSTSSVDLDADNRPQIVGNKTEAALLLMAKSPFFGNDDYQYRRTIANFNSSSTEQGQGGSRLFPFSSKRKRMSVLLQSSSNNTGGKEEDWTLYHKGAGEMVLADCTHYTTSSGTVQPITPTKRAELQQVISTYAKQALRCVALTHRPSIQTIPTITIHPKTCTESELVQYESGLVLDALLGIIDPLRADVVDAVKTCQRAGIFVRMVTGDSLETANAIATQAGILTDGISMIGEDFRKLTPAQLDKILPNLQVLARSSPEDKHILVERLNGGLMPKTKEEWCAAHPNQDFDTMKDVLLPGYYDEWSSSPLRRNGVGEVVGVTGDGTNDGPALKAADVGLSMGISGTDVAKNASDIIILDDKFSSIVKAVLWGRSVFDNIRKFLQFQLTVNVVALTITFLSAVAGYKPPLNAVMMLWVNLIMDTMGALALGTEPPTPDLLNRKPYKRDASLISRPMWRNILIQSSYQLALLIFLLKNGSTLFGCEDGSTHHFTIIFNAFVFCQVFNEFNAREIGDIFHPFSKLSTSPMFLCIIFFTVLAQWGIVEFGGDFTQTTPLSFYEWKVTFLLGALSIPIGFLMRQIPVKEDPESFAGLDNGEEVDDEVTEEGMSKSTSVIMFIVVPIVAAVAYKYFGDMA